MKIIYIVMIIIVISFSVSEQGGSLRRSIAKAKETKNTRTNSSEDRAEPQWLLDLKKGRKDLDPRRPNDWKVFYQDLFRKHPMLCADQLEKTLDQETVFPDLENAVCYYLSPSGNDSGTGSYVQPFRTLEHVRDLLRSQRSKGELTCPVRIIFKEGTYSLKETFRLGPEDSGTRKAPVSFEAEENKKVILSGGLTFKGSTFKGSTFKGSTFKKVAHVEGGEFGGPDLWEGTIDSTASALLSKDFDPKQLFINGRRMISARYPNEDRRDLNRRGFLYHGRGECLLAGLSCQGDFLQWNFSASETKDYFIWISAASAIHDLKNKFRLKIDGLPVSIDELKSSGDWRKTCWSRLARIHLTMGKHSISLESTAPKGSLNRMHLARLLLFHEKEARPEVDLPCLEISVKDYSKGSSSTMPLTLLPVRQPKADSIFFTSDSKDSFIIDKDRIQRWQKESQGRVCVFPAWGWFNSLFRMGKIESRSFLKEGTSIELIGKEFRELYQGNRFYVYNLRTELDAPGEWYYNQKSRVLSVIPFEDQWKNSRESNIKNAEIVLPLLTRLIELKGTIGEISKNDPENNYSDCQKKGRVEFIRLKDLTFSFCEYTEDQTAPRSTEDCALLLENAWNCCVENCRFEHSGGYAIRLTLDSVLNRIQGCDIDDMGGGGILLRGPWCGRGETVFEKNIEFHRYYPTCNYLADNSIHDSGRIRIYVAGIHAESRPNPLRYSPGNVFVHQTICRMPRNGIFSFWNAGGDVISKNHIHHVLNRTDDGGMIHYCTGALNETAPSLIEKNLLHEVAPFRNEDHQFHRKGRDCLANGHGIYLDDQSSGFVVRDNVISGTRKGAIFLHGGSNNLIENNFIFDDSYSQLWESDGWFNTLKRNVFVWNNTEATLYTPPPVETFKEGAAGTFYNNLIWNSGNDVRMEGRKNGAENNWRQWQDRGLDEKSKIIDPQIRKRDLSNRVLEFDRLSPIFQFGIKPVDLSEVGVRSNINREKQSP